MNDSVGREREEKGKMGTKRTHNWYKEGTFSLRKRQPNWKMEYFAVSMRSPAYTCDERTNDSLAVYV